MLNKKSKSLLLSLCAIFASRVSLCVVSPVKAQTSTTTKMPSSNVGISATQKPVMPVPTTAAVSTLQEKFEEQKEKLTAKFMAIMFTATPETQALISEIQDAGDAITTVFSEPTIQKETQKTMQVVTEAFKKAYEKVKPEIQQIIEALEKLNKIIPEQKQAIIAAEIEKALKALLKLDNILL